MNLPLVSALALQDLRILAALAGYRLAPLGPGPGRLMSFAKTWPQYIDGTKTVTRRDKTTLRPGDIFTGVSSSPRAGRGYRRGPQSIVLSVEQVRLGDITTDEVGAEGFPGHSVDWFVDLYCAPGAPEPDRQVFRIQFERLAELTGRFETEFWSTATEPLMGGSYVLERWL